MIVRSSSLRFPSGRMITLTAKTTIVASLQPVVRCPSNCRRCHHRANRERHASTARFREMPDPASEGLTTEMPNSYTSKHPTGVTHPNTPLVSHLHDRKDILAIPRSTSRLMPAPSHGDAFDRECLDQRAGHTVQRDPARRARKARRSCRRPALRRLVVGSRLRSIDRPKMGPAGNLAKGGPSETATAEWRPGGVFIDVSVRPGLVK